mmetsp:Transcript_11032/g.38310  ORF Transcript_11032/g.38310 Transcript_11032/m.38310 type:complete len:281 (+) Transcript_11032:902-1744(+)
MRSSSTRTQSCCSPCSGGWSSCRRCSGAAPGRTRTRRRPKRTRGRELRGCGQQGTLVSRVTQRVQPLLAPHAWAVASTASAASMSMACSGESTKEYARGTPARGVRRLRGVELSAHGGKKAKAPGASPAAATPWMFPMKARPRPPSHPTTAGWGLPSPVMEASRVASSSNVPGGSSSATTDASCSSSLGPAAATPASEPTLDVSSSSPLRGRNSSSSAGHAAHATSTPAAGASAARARFWPPSRPRPPLRLRRSASRRAARSRSRCSSLAPSTRATAAAE